MKFTKIEVWDGAATYWVSGIYKIVKYKGGNYNAYFIQDFAKNWGDHVCPPPDNDPRGNYWGKCWHRLADAKRDIKAHAATYMPAPKTIKRASDRIASLLENSNQW